MIDLTENTRKFLKERVQKDRVTLYGFDKEQNELRNLLLMTSNNSQSNSALLLGKKSGGKTTLVNSVLAELLRDKTFVSNVLIICLNGLIQTNERQALNSITNQMNMDMQVAGKVFKSFAENLSFLLTCFASGSDSKRLIFIIDEFDLFCAHSKQTLLYNLFDVAQSAQTPICVLGVTSRFDTIDLLEKRVKSRFSHRQIFLLPDNDDFKKYVQIFTELLMLPTSQDLANFSAKNPPLPYKVLESFKLPFLRRPFQPNKFQFPDSYVAEWNSHIHNLLENEKLFKALEQFYESNFAIQQLKFLLYQVVLSLDENHSKITANNVIKHCESILRNDDKVTLMRTLSVLEICMLIAIKHHCEIYDNDPFNFEMIFMRFNKFAVKSTTMQGIEREMVMKRFDNLKYLELIVALGSEGKVQKEYQMYKVALLTEQVDKAVQSYRNLPTEIEQWNKSSYL